MLFEVISMLSLFLSSGLAMRAYIESKPRIHVEFLSIYNMADRIFLKILIDNRSSNPIAISRIELQNKILGRVLSSTNYQEKIFWKINRTKGKVTGSAMLNSEKLPINVPAKSGRSFFVAFAIDRNTIDLFCKNDLDLNLKIAGKFYCTSFSPGSLEGRLEILEKELLI